MNDYFEKFRKDVSQMSIKEHAYYWILPAIILGVLMIFYFSGIPKLVEIVCPKENWEWGILENIQLLIIFTILILSLVGINRKNNLILKWGFFLISIFTIFIFLEEIDYGEHFAQLIGGEKEEFLNQYIPEKNIHNQGNNAKIFKRSVYFVMAVIFIIAPFLKSKIQQPYIKYLIPRPRIVIVAVLAIISDLVPRLLVYSGLLKDGGLGVNIGEFSEVMVYYIFFIYIIQLIFFNRLNINTSSEPLSI